MLAVLFSLSVFLQTAQTFVALVEAVFIAGASQLQIRELKIQPVSVPERVTLLGFLHWLQVPGEFSSPFSSSIDMDMCLVLHIERTCLIFRTLISAQANGECHVSHSCYDENTMRVLENFD